MKEYLNIARNIMIHTNVVTIKVKIIDNLVMAAILAIRRVSDILLKVLCSLDCINNCSKCYSKTSGF
jgi:hypothetical protein